jgi:hypothetical protein
MNQSGEQGTLRCVLRSLSELTKGGDRLPTGAQHFKRDESRLSDSSPSRKWRDQALNSVRSRRQLEGTSRRCESAERFEVTVGEIPVDHFQRAA